jgi:hypothetical protein
MTKGRVENAGADSRQTSPNNNAVHEEWTPAIVMARSPARELPECCGLPVMM